jgi:hypothetical protein
MVETVLPPSEYETLQGVPSICRRMAELLRRPELTERQCYYYLQTGIWPGVHRGGNWELRPARVLEEARAAEDAAIAARRARLAAKAGNGGQHPPKQQGTATPSKQQPRSAAPPRAPPR